MAEEKSNLIKNLKRGIVLAIIGVIIGLVYFSGPAIAFYVTATPTVTHTPGTRDANVTVTFYKERYEAIGDMYAKLAGMNINGDTSTSGPNDAAATTDVNCQAGSDYYSYGESAYIWNIANHDRNILAYGYVDMNDQLTPGTDINSAYRFKAWSDTLGFTNPAQTAYYGYGYNYAGTFTCTFYFHNIPDGIWTTAVPYINGIGVSTAGFDQGGSGTRVDINNLFAIATISTTGNTDINFVTPEGQKKAYFSLPFNGSNGTKGTDYITVDINIQGVNNPSNATIMNVPRFTYGSSVGSTFRIDQNSQQGYATLDMFYAGFLTDAEASKSTFNVWRYSNGVWGKVTDGREVNTDIDRIRVRLGSFSEYAMGQDSEGSSGTCGNGSCGTGETCSNCPADCGQCTTPPGPGDGGGGPGGGGGGVPPIPPGATVETIFEETKSLKPTPEQLLDILTRAGASANAIEKATAAVGKTTVMRTIRIDKITDTAGNITYRSYIALEVKNPNIDKALNRVKIVEEVPKSVALNASEISSELKFDILKDDPIIQFTALEINPKSSFKAEYVIAKDVTNLIADFGPPVISEIGAETAIDLCTGKNCDDGDECTTDSCNSDTGQCQHAAIAGCSAVIPSGEAAAGDYTWAIILIIVIVIAVGIVYYYSAKKKRR